MKLQQSISWSWTVNQTDLWFYTTAILYIDKDLVTADMEIGDFFQLLDTSRLYSGSRLNNIFLFSRGAVCSVLQ